MPNPVLYYDDISPPVRSVLLTLAALGIKDKVDFKWIDLFSRGHLEESFVELNPLHTVPVLQHDDLILTDSHAILMYLCDEYGMDSPFSLKDPKKRARVHNRLCFNNAVLFRRDSELFQQVFRGTIKNLSEHTKPIEEAFDYLESYLNESSFVACDELTIADFSIVATLSTAEIACPVNDGIRWPRLAAWYGKMKLLPYYETENQIGLDKLKMKIKAALG
ncbi:glutathione S-transferase E14-like [Uranotaenia lowii]|uniref:glutathione S-transferase E14-like n=1 Tax=Uranotaenia lowii TaxID=190385 RepID=UPI00247AD4F3|nr:glutathione S-transferase E14-like [Uranotaenia lowii]XP_055596603.1 glutathione S-transferase E14-like [Uranotaenia lowii]XP_055596604.1 glutathione S-transferase E14-like [Uranotaenia lowii]